jgi:hypothetical protein
MVAILALMLAASPARPAEKLNVLLGRIARAYGGERALARLRTYRETGTLESQRGVARTMRLFSPPDRLRVEIVYADGSGEARVVDGRTGWRNGEPVAGPPLDAMLLQAARLDLPGLLLRNRRRLIDLGDVHREGRTLRGVGVPLSGSLNLAVTVDPRTALIVHSEGALPGPGGQIRFATDYADFRSVGGVLFAFHEANFASGQKTGETRLEKIELLASAPAGAFRP